MFYLVTGGIVLSFGIVGNSAVIFYFGYIRKCEKKYELAILILGIADLIASISNVIVDWVKVVPPYGWKFDGIMCKYITEIGFSTNTFACYALVLLFYVRYCCIIDLTQNNLTKTKIIFASVIIFTLSISSGIVFILSRVYEDGWCYNGDNTIFGGTWKNYYICIIMIYPIGRFLIPLILMICFYWGTKRCLQRSAATIANEVANQRNKRVLRTIMWLIIVFVVSVGLYEMYVFVRCVDYLTTKKIEWDENFSYSLMPSYYLNSAMNVIVYAGYMPGFRKFYSKILTCCKRKGKIEDVRCTQFKK